MFHSTSTLGAIHIPYNWEYANSTAREAATGFVAGDIGKLSRQLDNNTLWILTATTPSWVRIGATSENAAALVFEAKKASAGTITKGQLVRIVSSASGVPLVELAKADSASTLPSVGFALNTITDSVAGTVIAVGVLSGVNTDTIDEGTELFVSATVAGAFSATRPTAATSFVQQCGVVMYEHATLGVIYVSPASIVNNPKLSDGKLWIGDVGNNAAEATAITDTIHGSRGGGSLHSGATKSSAGFMSAQQVFDVERTLSTGLTSGGGLSINVDPTKFDIAAGTGIVSDCHTDPTSPVVTPISWGAKTAVVPTYIGSGPVSYIAIDVNGNVVQSDNEWSYSQLRDYIVLGVVTHPGPVIVATAMRPRWNPDSGSNLLDFAKSFGPFNITGNTFSANGANLKLDKSAGTAFRIGVSYSTDKKSPNVSVDALATQAPFFRVYRDGAGGWTVGPTTTTDVTPDVYDDDSGTPAAVTAGYWTIQRIFMYPGSGQFYVYLGQAQYATLDAAKAAYKDSPELNPDLGLTIFRSWLIVQQGTTVLNSETYATFIAAGKFGLTDVTSGAGGGESNVGENVGTSGIGVYKGKSGLALQFKKINPASSKITVVSAESDNRVDLDLGPHKPTHISGGSDAFASTDVLEAIVKRLQTTTGPTTLLMGAVADGQYLKRSGTAIIGDAPSSLFGTQWQYANSAGESTTTATSYQQKLKLTTPSLPAGTYRIEWFWEWNFDSASYDFMGRVQLDDTTDLSVVNMEPKDVVSYHPASGFIVTALSAAVHTIDIDFASENGSTASIRRARLAIFRVS